MSEADLPVLWLVAGPDGVGETTYAFRHIRLVSGSVHFVNVDVDGLPALLATAVGEMPRCCEA